MIMQNLSIKYPIWVHRYQMLIIKYRSLAIRSQILFIVLGSPVFFYFDSPEFKNISPYGQWLDDYIMFWTYVWFYCFANARLRNIMILGSIVGLGLEILGSKILGAYTYRLENIPIYIPLGHSIILATVYHINNQTIVSKYAHRLTMTLYPLAFLMCSVSLLLWDDMGGMILLMIFMLLLVNMKNKLPHLISFFFSYYLELFGTQMHAWEWHSTMDWPHMANPPSGIGAAYLILHLIVINSYHLLKQCYPKKQYVSSRFS